MGNGGMKIAGLLKNRVWGFRLIEISAFCVLIALALAVYLAKVGGAKDSQEIAGVERDIAMERQRIRLLEAAVARNEQPARIEHLSSTYLKMAPTGAKQELEPAALVDIARKDKPATETVLAVAP
jgi:hypothetical protein